MIEEVKMIEKISTRQMLFLSLNELSKKIPVSKITIDQITEIVKKYYQEKYNTKIPPEQFAEKVDMCVPECLREALNGGAEIGK